MPDGRLSYALVTPVLRPAMLEELSSPLNDAMGFRVLAWSRQVVELGSDDPSRSGVVAAEGYFRSLRLACCRPPHVLEVPEPLWYRMWPATFVFIWLVRATCRIRGMSLLVATYAIGNLPVAEGLTTARVTDRLGNKLQLLDRIAAAVLDWSASRSIDHVLYGSEAARINYASALPRLHKRALATRVTSSFGRCHPCFPGPEEVVPREREVLFLGEFSDRKGIRSLMAAWQLLDGRPVGWRLTLIGYGELQDEVERWAAGLQDVHVEADRSRTQIHAALRRVAVVVLPSCRVRGWREQLGLPILEGLSHGCRIVTTSETGLAPDLSRDGHVVIAHASPEALKTALLRLLRSMEEEADTKTIPAPGAETTRGALIRVLLGEEDKSR